MKAANWDRFKFDPLTERDTLLPIYAVIESAGRQIKNGVNCSDSFAEKITCLFQGANDWGIATLGAMLTSP